METVIFTTAITAGISAVISGVIATLIAAARLKGKGTVDGMKGYQTGMRALLWRELKSLYEDAEKDGGMTIEERRHLENVYGAYHSLGGNGTGTRLFDEAMKLKVLDDGPCKRSCNGEER